MKLQIKAYAEWLKADAKATALKDRFERIEKHTECLPDVPYSSQAASKIFETANTVSEYADEEESFHDGSILFDKPE